MPTISVTREVHNLSPDHAFEETLGRLPGHGFVIWKTRPLAWLVIANHEHPQGTINANISFRPGAHTMLAISLAGDSHEETELQTMADGLADALVADLSSAQASLK